MYLQNNNYLQNHYKLPYPQYNLIYNLPAPNTLSNKRIPYHHNTNQYYTNRHTTLLINYTSSDEHIKNKIFYYAIKNKLTMPNIKSIYIKRIIN